MNSILDHNTIVNSSNATDLFLWTNKPKRLKLFEKGDHNEIIYLNQIKYFSLLDQFIKEI